MHHGAKFSLSQFSASAGLELKLVQSKYHQRTDSLILRLELDRDVILSLKMSVCVTFSQQHL